jgi:hypothetical protein
METKLTLTAAVCACMFVLAISVAVAADEPNPAALAVNTSAPTPSYVGLRRSSYGLRKLNTEDVWWADRAKQFAAHFPGSQPLILHILSNYQDDGTTQIEFKKPETYHGSTTNMSFLPRGKLNHERALTTYDEQGVKAILQFEPGSASVGDCFELAHAAFSRHQCVIGLAIDGEWFRTTESADQTGLPIPDADAQRWMEQVLRFNTNYVLVLKHFETKNLPPTYRHPKLWLLTDSQEFASQEDWMKDMRAWANTFKGSSLGSQYGYSNDRKWWIKSTRPPVDLGKLLVKEIPQYRMLLWVDFTAGQVRFGANSPIAD